MLTEICAEIRNYFCQDSDKHFGRFKIEDGEIEPLDFLLDGQYFRIVGSTLNDGVYQYPTSGLADEGFDGAIWAMKLPPSFIALCTEIESYVASEQGKPSGYTSESFGGYSYTKATDSKGRPLTWQGVFAKRLNVWRKI